ncbi:Glutamate receptor 3.3 [Zea mays]|uniref:Glutamate receptor n=1 Tax=Zea mays TaxID=4577 RepID=A0A1D6QUL0_MAIZE|nr:Glutamate receptor 3.3 [Zea mays]AQK61072.1 Glutamate receptor 3.3 [Zea mays]
MRIAFLVLLVLSLFLLPNGIGKSLAARPSVVNIGSILRLNSTTGGVSDVAIRAAVEDINSDPTVLNGTTLHVQTRDTNCDDGFLGMVQALQFMETDVIAIIGPQCSPIAHIISYVANELQVPLMSFASDATLSSIQFPFFVRTMPSDLYQMAAVAAVIDYYQWKIVTAIYVDDDYGRNGIAALDDELTARRCKISFKIGFRSNAKKSDLLNLLVTVSNMESRVIILHTGSEPGLKLLSLANGLNMMGNGYVWIATDWLSAYLDANSSVSAETINGMQGVLTVRPHTPKSKVKSNLVSKWSSLSKKYNHSDLRTSAYGFYVYDSVWTVARALDAFFDDGGRISFTNDSRLRDETGGTLHLEAMSVFDMGNKLLNKIRNVNFTGVSGQVQFNAQFELIHPAYDIISIIGNGMRTIGFWSNYTRLLSTVLPEDLYSKPPNTSLANQQLYDVIWPGETAQRPRGWAFPSNAKELKIGVPNRFSFKDFVSKDNATGSMKGYCIDVFTQALALLPYPVTYRFIPFGNGTENPHYSQLVQMVADNLDTSIRGLDDLKNSDYPIGFQVGSFVEEYMIKELNISQSRLKALGSPEEYAENLKLGPKKGGVMAIVDERPYVELFLSTYCKIAVAGSDFTSGGWGFAFPRDSPLQIDLSTAILTLSENGELQRIHDKWLKTGDCSTDNAEFVDSNQLRLESFMGLFLICGAACVLALLIYLGITIRQYLRHEQPGPAISVDAGSSTSKRSLRKFISFADDKQPPPKKKRAMSLSRSSMPTMPMSNRPGADIDVES